MPATLTLEIYDNRIAQDVPSVPEEDEMSVGSVWQELMQTIELARRSLRNGALELGELHAQRAWEMYLTFRGVLDVYSNNRLATKMQRLADDFGVDVSGLVGWMSASRPVLELAA